MALDCKTKIGYQMEKRIKTSIKKIHTKAALRNRMRELMEKLNLCKRVW